MSTIKGTRRKQYLDETMATVCKVCGKRYKMLGKHVFKHGYTPESYKLEHGLPLSVGLCSSATFEKLSELRVSEIKENPDRLLKMRLQNPPGKRWPIGRARGVLSLNLPFRAKAYRDHVRAAATAKWEARKEEFVSMWLAGVPMKDMAVKYTTTVSSIRNWVRNWNLPRRTMTFVILPKLSDGCSP
ncbi:MAG: MucR family transcriptional regulator [Xanthomonadaceae bacterium]|nr:MucR family transcriptional regulator [Xanthomonadaceae bacterium]